MRLPVRITHRRYNMAVAGSDFAVGAEQISGPVVRRLCLKNPRIFAYVVLERIANAVGIDVPALR